MINYNQLKLVVIGSFFKRARDKGMWEKIMNDLVKKSRIAKGRSPNPTYSIIDSQSIKKTYAAKEREIDGGKKVKGRKRHIVTDTQGHILHIPSKYTRYGSWM